MINVTVSIIKNYHIESGLGVYFYEELFMPHLSPIPQILR